ncbi:MAG: ABC transporter permease [Chloroflexi bacterium]|nr:ABC transporter permease [Chloroflexota bacterium]
MTGYVIRRLLGMAPTLLLLVLAVVIMMRIMPADIVDVLLSEQAADDNARQELRARLGLDKSLPRTYVEYLGGLTTGDLGTSLLKSRPVRDMIGERINVTLELAVFALAVSLTIGITIGVISAIARDTPVDYVLRSIGLLGLVVPTFALATAAILLPALYFNWSPPISYVTFDSDPIGHLTQFILPGVVLGAAAGGVIMRVTRTQMLEVLRQDYVRTARMKGLRERRVIIRHVLKNAMIPVVSVFGLQVAALMSGAVIIENVFALPGLGRLLVDAVNQRDYPVVQGVTLVVGTFVMAVNLVVDLSYVLFDPRIRLR